MHAVILAPGSHERVRVLECADALRAQPDIHHVEVLPADSDADVDSALTTTEQRKARLVVAGSDGVLRAVVGAMVRRALPHRGQNRQTLTPQLPEHRTIGDLPPIGLLSLDASPQLPDLARSLKLPTAPAQVAEIVAAGKSRRLDLFRNDRGGVTLHGVLLGAAVASSTEKRGRLVAWQAHVQVDDTLLCEGDEPILACAIANADGYARLGNLPLLTVTDPASGSISIAIAVAKAGEIEIRRAHGRAVSVRLKPVQASTKPSSLVSPHLNYTDDGVDFTLRHPCTWWVEQQAWALYVR